MTGEVFVDDGLEDALNIDRDSFNRFNPEFRELQSYVHQVLQESVFPQVYDQIVVRSTERQRRKQKARVDHLRDSISKVTEKATLVQLVKTTLDEEGIPTVTISRRDRKLIVEIPGSDHVRTKKAHRQLATAILAIFEVARRENTPEEQRKAFSRMILELLDRW